MKLKLKKVTYMQIIKNIKIKKKKKKKKKEKIYKKKEKKKIQ